MATPAVEVEVDGPHGPRAVRVSSPDKPYFPELGITKRQVVDYFLAVGDGVLGALRDRPTTLERWPGGVVEGAKLSTRQDHSGDAFYQKRVPKGAPDYVETARITFPSGRPADEVCPTELAVVVWAANLGTLTFHPWPVRRDHPDHPDQLRIDLDPQPGTDFSDAVAVAHEARALLAELGMAGFPKTSGGRGLHLYVPVEPRWDFVEARRAVIAFGRELERRLPDRVTTSWWKEERGARIFIDYNQMARDRTIASAYSIRPTPRALVSTPLDWDELDFARPEDFTIRTVPERFARVGDLHARVAQEAFSLEPLLELSAEQGAGDLPYPPEYPKMAGEPKRVQPSKARPD
ncbi:non-homologous end-joining DNA ligase [Actinokineospora bangkokensis]|uniref:ATP-dependent DNA ligase n=1 Tax=Actinokineospora bangkokensis TaxID=1193682 RepID=A0A1Q9LSK3_9PSEU|nr:non-homologous end-joining DNA ligase [Actinokineospora bangkokensis]OLR94981.1 ATP-dependent DNA ligase [Actinokineospora bangkokensis]